MTRHIGNGSYHRGIAILLLILVAATAGALDVQREILQPAQRYYGTDYCHGGVSLPCFDCSGFILHVYGNHVPGLPRISRDIARFASPVSRSDLRPGDLVFFATGGRADVITHVAIYMGQESIIHAISNGPNRGVTVTPITARYWERRFHSAGRVLPQASQVTHVQENNAIEFAQGTYTGDLSHGEPHGQGEMIMRNGDQYEGSFRNGLFDGQGVYTWDNGDRYQGQFRQGEMHGQGVFVTAAGNETRGRWESGSYVPPPSEPTRTAQATSEQTSRRTYIRAQDSPWETWDGIVEGDFRAWQDQQRDAFEEHRRRTEPSRR